MVRASRSQGALTGQRTGTGRGTGGVGEPQQGGQALRLQSLSGGDRRGLQGECSRQRKQLGQGAETGRRKGT